MKPRRASPEHQLQVAVAQYLTFALRPPVLWTALDAGAGKMSKASAGLRKARGVKRGWPDILIIAPGNHFYNVKVIAIELKSMKGSLSEAQKDVRCDLAKCGGGYAVCRSLDDVESVLKAWVIPLHATVSALGERRAA